ncbi:MAG: hypothetical protein WBV55_14625 [Candidatus Sulfotelmatobacter sp.]
MNGIVHSDETGLRRPQPPFAEGNSQAPLTRIFTQPNSEVNERQGSRVTKEKLAKKRYQKKSQQKKSPDFHPGLLKVQMITG